MFANRGKKFGLIIGVLICLAVGVFMVIMLSQSDKEAAVTITDKDLQIKGMFGTSLPLSEIEEVSRLEVFPAVITKNNGSGLGSTLKGEFTLEGLGRGRVYVDKDKAPFILLKTAKSFVILNYQDPAQTEALLAKLKAVKP